MSASLGKTSSTMQTLLRFGQALPGPRADVGVLDVRDELFGLKPGIPHVQGPHRAEPGHGFAVRPDAGQHGIAGELVAEAVGAACEDKAGGQAFDVPLPRGRKRFIKVVNVEDDPPLRRGKAAEIAQVRIAARLHAKARGGCAGQVHRHVERRPAIEGERRRQHAAVAQGNQLGDSPAVGFLDQPERDPAGRAAHSRRRGSCAGIVSAWPRRARSVRPAKGAARRSGVSRRRAVASRQGVLRGPCSWVFFAYRPEKVDVEVVTRRADANHIAQITQ